MRIEDSIASRLPERTAQLERVAEDLGMSPRTLARRLAEREDSFAGILDALRATLAIYHLNGTELSVSQIGWLLGYRETSSFVRAMKRWSGSSPGQFRRDLRTG
jgi:AraC-like DNA-binding protein